MSNNIVQVSDESFEREVLNADGPERADPQAVDLSPCSLFLPFLGRIVEFDQDLAGPVAVL